jgi:4-hydroxy-L-threonine phosphate dehydrogenase PdxA
MVLVDPRKDNKEQCCASCLNLHVVFFTRHLSLRYSSNTQTNNNILDKFLP